MDIFASSTDHQRFLELLEQTTERFAIDVYAYVQMTNHYHLLVETRRPNLSKAMHYLNSTYSQYFNYRYKRIGHFFQGRYSAVLVEKDAYLLEVSRYIHLNPVRAGIAHRPEQYPWTTYRDYINKTGRAWIKANTIVSQFSGNKYRAKALYKQFVEEALESKENPLRNAVGGLLLGNEKFVEKMRKALADSEQDAHVLDPPAQAIPFENVMLGICRKMNIPRHQILQPGKRDNLPRRICLYLLKEMTDLSNAEIASRFSVTESAVSKVAARMAEEMKRQPALKKYISEIEEGVRLDT